MKWNVREIAVTEKKADGKVEKSRVKAFLETDLCCWHALDFCHFSVIFFSSSWFSIIFAGCSFFFSAGASFQSGRRVPDVAQPHGIDKPKKVLLASKNPPEIETARGPSKSEWEKERAKICFWTTWWLWDLVLVWSLLKRRQAKLLAAKLLTGWSPYTCCRPASWVVRGYWLVAGGCWLLAVHGNNSRKQLLRQT